jgi:hypothetical protein
MLRTERFARDRPAIAGVAVFTVTISQIGATRIIGLLMSRDAAMASSDGLRGSNCAARKRRKMKRSSMPTMLL